MKHRINTTKPGDSQKDSGARGEPSPAPGFSHKAQQVTMEKVDLTIFVVLLMGHFSLLFLLPNQVFPLLINFDFLSEYFLIINQYKKPLTKTQRRKQRSFNSTLRFYDICQLKKKTKPRQNFSIL